ncbi:MAG TPA: hypothetical protein VF329_04290 [Gammaproteobacteria bacterium]
MDLKDVVLFRSGVWNGLEVDEAMLDDIAANFSLLSAVHRVPLKLGHKGKAKEQLADDGTGLEQPALGFAENVRRVGDKLLADFRDVPGIVKDAIKKRLYSGLSIELLRGVKFQGKVLGNVLDAVALLGASQPAVSGLKDLATYLASRECFEDAGERLSFEFSDEPEKPGIDEAKVAEMIRAAVDPLKAENDELRKQLDAEKAKAAKFEADLGESRAAEVKQRRAKAEAIIERAVKDNRILPAQRETFERLFNLDDDATVMRDGLLDELERAFSGATSLAFTTVEVAWSDPSAFERERDVFAEIERRVRVVQAKQGLAYKEALSQVFAADPQLQREWLDTTPPEHVRAG